MEADPSFDGQIALSIAQSAKRAGVSRSKLYEELSAGRLHARKLGRRTLILAADLSLWLSSLPTIRP